MISAANKNHWPLASPSISQKLYLPDFEIQAPTDELSDALVEGGMLTALEACRRLISQFIVDTEGSVGLKTIEVEYPVILAACRSPSKSQSERGWAGEVRKEKTKTLRLRS